MKEALEALNRLVEQGVIEHYAIGGAVAAFYYIEPAVTMDVDAFVSFSSQSSLISLEPIYAALREMGYREFHREGILIGTWPVQFLVPGIGLLEDALTHRIPVEFDGVPTYIFTVEHLAAICLELGRTKDRQRIADFVQDKVLNKVRLLEILDRFGMRERWEVFLKSNDLHF